MSYTANLLLGLTTHALKEANKSIETMGDRIKELEAELAEARASRPGCTSCPRNTPYGQVICYECLGRVANFGRAAKPADSEAK